MTILLRWPKSCLGLFLAFACAAMPSLAEVTELNVVAPQENWPRVSRSYPSMDEVFSRTGVPRSVTQVRRVQIGATKSQLVNVVGRPVAQSRDGSWYFSLGLPLPQGNRLICQYRVFFDADEFVSGTAWRRPQCADIIINGR